jgi:hypothetical protein
MSVLIAPEEADACSLGALTERCLCKIAHSQDHPSMPLYQLTDRHRRARRLGGCRGDRPSNGLSRATSSGLYERGDGCQAGCRSRDFRSANVFFQFPTPHFIAAAQNRRRTKVFIPTVAAGIAELWSLRYLPAGTLSCWRRLATEWAEESRRAIYCGLASRRLKCLGVRWRGRIDRPLPAWTACFSHNNFSSRPVALTVAQTVAAVIEKEARAAAREMQSSTPSSSRYANEISMMTRAGMM